MTEKIESYFSAYILWDISLKINEISFYFPVEVNIIPDRFGRGKYPMLFLVMVFFHEIEKVRAGMGKVNRQGYKVEPAKDR